MTYVAMTSAIWKLILATASTKMAMPRPRGKPLKIASKVVPGLKESLKGIKDTHPMKGRLSEVEIRQTNNIENREGGS